MLDLCLGLDTMIWCSNELEHLFGSLYLEHQHPCKSVVCFGKNVVSDHLAEHIKKRDAKKHTGTHNVRANV